MKYLLLSLFLVISTSFSLNKPSDEIWIGTFQVYLSENKEFVIYYEGNYHSCFTKFVIDKLFESCDSMNNANKLDSLFQIDQIKLIKPKTWM